MGYLFWGEVWSGNFPIRHSRYIPIPVRVTSFPHLWLSSCGEKNFTTCGNSSCGKKRFHHSWLRHSWWNIFSPRLLFPLVVEFFSPRLLSHSWGKLVTCTGIGMYLSWLMGKFFFPHSWLRHSWGEKPDHTSPQKRYGTFLLTNSTNSSEKNLKKYFEIE